MKKLTQRERILEYLSTHPEGLNSYTATYDMKIKQAPTRIKELRDRDYKIDSVPQKDGSVNWVLRQTPPKVIKHYRIKDNVAYVTEEIIYEFSN